MSKTILFFGTDQFSARVLTGLLNAGVQISGVITKPDSRSGRGQQMLSPLVKGIAEQASIPVLQPARLLDLVPTLTALESPMAILASYGKIIPQAMLELFDPGIINIHPSLLPHYRGASPIESAILNGDATTGVSIMRLVAAMDAGPIYAQSRVTLTGTETAETLSHTLADEGVRLLVEHLASIINGSLTATPQADTATYCAKIQKSDGIIDWLTPAVKLERQIRAYHSWPQSRTQLGKIEAIITKARPLATAQGIPGHMTIADSRLMIATSEDSLSIEALKPLGKKEMPIEAFLRGYRSQL